MTKKAFESTYESTNETLRFFRYEPIGVIIFKDRVGKVWLWEIRYKVEFTGCLAVCIISRIIGIMKRLAREQRFRVMSVIACLTPGARVDSAYFFYLLTLKEKSRSADRLPL